MAYDINLASGVLLITLPDGTKNTTASSLTLVGKKFPNFGEIINENLVHILENHASTSPPANPLKGQLWFDSSTGINLLKVYDGTLWNNVALPSTITSNLTFTGTTTFTADATFSGSATFTTVNFTTANFANTTTFADAVNLDGLTTIGGSSIFNAVATFNSAAILNSNLTVDQNTTIGGTLDVSGVATFTTPPVIPSTIVASLPSASPAAQVIFISDETGGATLAYSDGTNWRRVSDRAIAA